MNYNRRNLFQERLAKEDITLLISALETANLNCSHTRRDMLITKLKRMEQQK